MLQETRGTASGKTPLSLVLLSVRCRSQLRVSQKVSILMRGTMQSWLKLKKNKGMTLAIDLLEIMQTPKDSSKIASHQYGNVSADKQLFKHLTKHTVTD